MGGKNEKKTKHRLYGGYIIINKKKDRLKEVKAGVTQSKCKKEGKKEGK